MKSSKKNVGSVFKSFLSRIIYHRFDWTTPRGHAAAVRLIAEPARCPQVMGGRGRGSVCEQRRLGPVRA